MAAKKKKKGGIGQLSFNWGKYDERVPKLLGILCIFLAVYLFIAFTSYLFTWQEDQDRVLQFSWGLLLEGDVQMSNWLGRLGAIVSNIFFYWGFGIPSFIFIFLLGIIGMGKVQKVPTRQYTTTIWNSFLMLLFFSVLLEFIFRKSTFPWGGAFGEGVSSWLVNFVGVIGTIALLIFLVIAMMVWSFNPNFNEMTPQSFMKSVKYFFEDLFSGRLFKKRRTVQTTNTALPGLRPRGKKAAVAANAGAILSAGNSAVNGNASTDTYKPDLELSETSEIPANTSTTPTEPTIEKGQLAFDIEKAKKAQKPQSLKSGDSALEITPAPENTTSPPPSSQPVIPIQQENVNHGEPYDPTLELGSYEHPVLPLLNDYADQKVEIDRAELEQNKDQIIETLLNYKIEIIKIKATIGPTVTLYEIVPAPGVLSLIHI